MKCGSRIEPMRGSPRPLVAHPIIRGRGTGCLRLAALVAVLLIGVTVQAERARLAIVVEDPSFSSEGDFLTAELSHNTNLDLVERAELNKVLKEQALSTSHGTDFVRLGEILGADGVLMLDSMQKDGHERLTTRLAAVKPGVVLDLADYGAPVADKLQWSKIVAEHFAPFFPKLAVLPRDAVPISFLNLRSGVKSVSGEALEQELNSVLVRRLLHRKEIFLLERQKLQPLAQEKKLKGLADAPFWTGSFLLEGTLDRNGYNRETLTLSARLTPPGKRAPIDFEVSGRRSDPLPLINELASKILSAIGTRQQSQEWNAADEANRYFEEARWALNWRMEAEAQAAADAAWVLGRTDLDCALVRVKAHLAMTTPQPPAYYGYDRPENPLLVWEHVDRSPKRIALALRMLEAYDEFDRTLGPDEPSVSSAWYAIGIQALGAASQVLQLFHCRPAPGADIAEQLSELRDLTRQVAARLSGTPSALEMFWSAKSRFQHERCVP